MTTQWIEETQQMVQWKPTFVLSPPCRPPTKKSLHSYLACVAKELRGNSEIVMVAVSRDWRALRYATEALRRRFRHNRSDLLTLNVALMSGRAVSLLFPSNIRIQDVLLSCADLRLAKLGDLSLDTHVSKCTM